MHPESIPPNVQKERPSSNKSTFYCIKFFPAGDVYISMAIPLCIALFIGLFSAWAVAKDIYKLLKHEIEEFIKMPSKKPGDLHEGYRIAFDWLEEKDWLAKKDVGVEMAEDERATRSGKRKRTMNVNE
jgi:hypothetical protein